MSWLAFWAALELGFLPNGTMLMYQPSLKYNDLAGQFYTQLDAEAVVFDRLFVGGAVKTFVFDIEREVSFTPTQSWYSFRAGLRFPPLEAGWRHYCTHPVMPYMPLDPGGPVLWEGSYDELYVRLEVRTR